MLDLALVNRLKIRIRQFNERCTTIQEKFRAYHSNQRDRIEILTALLNEEKPKYHMKFMKAKNKKMEKCIRTIKPENITHVIDRYLRFI
jgi:hypothetical protein